MAVAAVAFLALLVVSAFGEHCVQNTKGILLGLRHDLQVRRLPAGQTDYDIELDHTCIVMTNGIRVTVCDPDAPPDPVIEILSFHHVRVKRFGIPWHDAELRATVYCLVGNARNALGPSYV